MRHQTADLWPAGLCPAAGSASLQAAVRTGPSPGTPFPSSMGPRCLWGCLGAFFSFALLWVLLLLLLLLLTQDAQKMQQASDCPHADHQEPSGTAALTHSRVDWRFLFQGDFPEPRCTPGQVLLILVTSAPGNAERRRAIRRTWAAQAQPPPPYPWQVVFLVGWSLSKMTIGQVQQEQRAFGDILLGGYLDTYRNLTLKVLHGLKWSVERCRPSFILKTDDDCFVNTDWLPEFLVKRHPLEHDLLYAGSVFPPEKRQVIRHPTSKWYVSREDYPASEYPPYASGVGYLLSLRATRLVLWAAEQVRPIPVEDAYIGILAWHTGLQLTPSTRFAKQNAQWHLCNYRYLFVIHHVSATEQEAATQSMREAHTSCRGNPQVSRWK
ncbi:beta-1,3-galactosyltransferase 5-like [Sceloporus undulatus]|uniref:beta-1,3-galactosyltransferase 5-like n=1 Tax=Sceloporus undulatus TaxID=8520 RepID=UPI001C4CF206|nr:beta-1,3-galactosyltransferase 5-like [Sceloporus undulatus]XP_042309637.1 beta-1,3-galactosyltransferase 5-like [Sceloporus undulatus]